MTQTSRQCTNVERGETWYLSEKSASSRVWTPRPAASIAKRHALIIVPRPALQSCQRETWTRYRFNSNLALHTSASELLVPRRCVQHNITLFTVVPLQCVQHLKPLLTPVPLQCWSITTNLCWTRYRFNAGSVPQTSVEPGTASMLVQYHKSLLNLVPLQSPFINSSRNVLRVNPKKIALFLVDMNLYLHSFVLCL